MPAWVSTVIGSNAVTPTAIMAIVLNLILPQTPVVEMCIRDSLRFFVHV